MIAGLSLPNIFSRQIDKAAIRCVLTGNMNLDVVVFVFCLGRAFAVER